MKGRCIVAIAFAAIVALSLCACGGSPSDPETADEEFTTLADAFAAEGTDTMWTYDKTTFVYIFKAGDVYKHVVAELPEGMKDKLSEAYFSEEKLAELLGPLPIAKQETLKPPSQEDLDAYVGKTGEELEAEGFVLSKFTVKGKEANCTAVKTPFSYQFTFDGTLDKNAKDSNEALNNLKVKSASIKGIDPFVLETD